jgi:hypothetical protein
MAAILADSAHQRWISDKTTASPPVHLIRAIDDLTAV